MADTERANGLIKVLLQAMNCTDRDDAAKLKSLLSGGSLSEQWDTVMSMASEGPLAVLSIDDLKFVAPARLEPGPPHGNEFQSSFDQVATKIASHEEASQATSALKEYNMVLEDMVSKLRTLVGRELATSRRGPNPSTNQSLQEQKLASLTHRKDSLKDQISALNSNIDARLNRYDTFSQPKASIGSKDTSRTGSCFFNDTCLANALDFTDYDRILEKLQSLGSELDYDADKDETILRDARRSANQIIMAMTNHCKSSLNTVFIESARVYNKNCPGTPSSRQTAAEERLAVSSEIESLWEEVIPVAHMAVEGQFLTPIIRKVKAAAQTKAERNSTISSYILAMLRYMNQRLETLVHRVDVLSYHNQTLSGILECLEVHDDQIPPLKPAQTNTQTTAQSSVNEENTRLVDVIKSHMEMYGPMPIDNERSSSSMDLAVIDDHVCKRASKGEELSMDMQRVFEAAAKAALTDSELGAQLLLDSILSDSAAGLHIPGAVYKDVQLENSLAALQEQVDEVEKTFRDLQLRGPASAPDFVTDAYNKATTGKSDHDQTDSGIECEKFEEFVRKWGDSSSLV
ncbi:hypothetical protein GGR56DRAFT_288229 [Xylariaceae sp. FL0804]|nr:hypothetical protein GGR56DRAFT_288229 [Xylariaceae sp. FL0804]